MNAFGLGLRRCIGEKLAWAEIWLVVANLIFNFDIKSGYEHQPLIWEQQKVYYVLQKEPVLAHLVARN